MFHCTSCPAEVCASHHHSRKLHCATGGSIGGGSGTQLSDHAGALVSLKDVLEDSKLNWEGFDKFGTVQDILEHNKRVPAFIKPDAFPVFGHSSHSCVMFMPVGP